MSVYMALIVALPFLCSLAEGHRIQYHALYPDLLESLSSHSNSHHRPTQTSRISFESETKYILNQSFMEVETKEQIQLSEKTPDTVESPTPDNMNNDVVETKEEIQFSEKSPYTVESPTPDNVNNNVVEANEEIQFSKTTPDTVQSPIPDNMNNEMAETKDEIQFSEKMPDTVASLTPDNMSNDVPSMFSSMMSSLLAPSTFAEGPSDAILTQGLDARFVPSTGTIAEDQSGDKLLAGAHGDAQQNQPQSLVELAASLMPLTATAAEDESTGDGEPDLETSVLSSSDQFGEQDLNDINKQVADQLKPEEPSVQSFIQTDAAEDFDGARLGDSGKATESESLPKLGQSVSSSTGSAADFDSVGVQQKGLGPELEAIVTPLVSTASEGKSDGLDLPADARLKQQRSGPELEASVRAESGASKRGTQAEHNNTAFPHVTAGGMENSSGGEQHLFQERSSILQNPKNSSISFQANLNAFSWDFFTSVPWPVSVAFVAVGLVTIIYSLIRSFRFSESKPFGCGFRITGSRQQHFHEGCMVYEWDQTMKEVSIYLRPPEGQLASDLEIKISSRHLQVGRKGRHCFLKEETYDVINAEMSAWTLDRSGELQIVLKKARRSKWPVALLHNRKMLGSPEMKSNAVNSNLKPIEVK